VPQGLSITKRPSTIDLRSCSGVSLDMTSRSVYSRILKGSEPLRRSNRGVLPKFTQTGFKKPTKRVFRRGRLHPWCCHEPKHTKRASQPIRTSLAAAEVSKGRFDRGRIDARRAVPRSERTRLSERPESRRSDAQQSSASPCARGRCLAPPRTARARYLCQTRPP
jgi:hypothetical protein